MITLSFSKLKDMECPYRFNAKHLDKSLVEPESDICLMGKDLAEALAAYRRHCLDKGLLSDIAYFQEHPRAWFDEGTMAPLIETFLGSPSALMPQTWDWCGVEDRLAFDANLDFIPDGWKSPEARFRMVSDFAYLAHGTLWIVDDKAGWSDPDMRQVLIYGYLLARMLLAQGHAVKAVKVIFNRLALRKIEDMGEYELRHLEWVRHELRERIVQVNAWKNFPAIECRQCPNCGVMDCPPRKTAVVALTTPSKAPQVPPTGWLDKPGQAESFLSLLVHGEALLEQVKAALKRHVLGYGPVRAAGAVARMKEKRSWRPRDLRKLVAVLGRYGVAEEEIWEALGLSRTEMERLAKRYKMKDRLPLLLAMGEWKSSEAFEVATGVAGFEGSTDVQGLKAVGEG